MSNICDVCDESYFRCKCGAPRKTDAKEERAACPCVYQDPLGRQCGVDHRFTVPRPGASIDELRDREYRGWLHYCEDHYEHERPYNATDEAMEQEKQKLEAKYGKFDDHKGKGMAAHCLKIMYEMGGQAAKVAKMLERSLNKVRREEKVAHG